MPPIKSYRRLFALAGPGYITIAFLGRLPLAMAQLGTLLLVAGSTGSYGAGGISAGALAVANAIGSPVSGAIADRRGQRRVVLV
ncbi:MAG: SAM-dependent methyltransferase, partial [Chloroflexota bacterium]|nr:SAM-dependent methyltransferase [Chloroflexota bacterium]